MFIDARRVSYRGVTIVVNVNKEKSVTPVSMGVVRTPKSEVYVCNFEIASMSFQISIHVESDLFCFLYYSVIIIFGINSNNSLVICV